ncbi:RloB family protein [Pseudoalteromonas sp.]|uniref:RloB family protein n=1 Tax=Pseudoalteromonas sp. TaxID=53249 RepID=UPI003002D48A
MPFENRDFNTPDYTEELEEPKKVVIISCEGSNTEPEYFDAVKRKLSDNLKNLVEVDIVPKPPGDSEPTAVLNNLKEHVKNKYDFNEGSDILWLVIDRESVEARKRNIKKIIPECNRDGYSIALSNPLFEFWLLLHVTDITAYDSDVLIQNKWVNASKNRRYIDKELSTILPNGFNKRKGKFNQDIVSFENVKRALAQEKLFTTSYPEILDSLGSNIGELIGDFLDLSE